MPFRTGAFIGLRTTAQILAFPVEQRKRGNYVYDLTTNEYRCYGVDAEAYPSILVGGGGGAQSTDVNTSGVPTLGPIDLIDGPGISLSRPAPGQVRFTATGGGEKEKPWNYHDLHNMLINRTGITVACHNSMPSQRCITQGADGRVYVLWHDLKHDDDFGDMWSLYLTIYYANTITGGWDTITYQLIMQGGSPTQPLMPKPADFCICMDAGFQGLEMLHILFIAENGDPPTTDVFDAYYPTSLIPRAPSASIQTLAFIAERVNQSIGLANPCDQVSAAFQSGLSAGPGIVVVWRQYDNDAGSVVIKSNIYDPTQAVFFRYNTGVTAYRECIVSDSTVNAESPTIECSNNANHCCYLLDIMGNNFPFYSNLAVNGQETVPNLWDNIMLVVNGSIDSKSALPIVSSAQYTTMVVLLDGQPGVLQDVIILATRDLDRPMGIKVYTFSMDIAVLPVPSLILSDLADVYDESKPINDQYHGFQLGCSMIVNSPIVGSPIPEVLLYKEMMNVWGVAFVKDFALLHRPYSTLGQNALAPFYHAPIECSIGDIIGAQLTPPSEEIRFHPKCHYSNLYNPFGWNTVQNQPWFPYNVYHHLRMGLSAVGGVNVFDVMIINEKPPYRM